MQSNPEYNRINWFLLLLIPLVFLKSCIFIKGTPFYEETMTVENSTWSLIISDILPSQNGGIISTDNNLVIFFNNSLDTSVSGKVSFANPLFTYEDNTNCTITFATTNYPNDTIIIDPYTDWMGNYNYSGLSVEGFIDFKGNLMEPITYVDYSFNTAGGSQPEVISISPLAGTLGFPASSNLTIVFNEAIDPGNPGRLEITSNARVYELKDGTSCTFYYATTNIPNDTVIVDPYSNLPGNLYYSIYIENFRDTQGGIMLTYFDSAYDMEVAGLLGEWRLDGSNVDDSSGNFYHSNKVTGTTPATNRYGTASSALYFNGAGEYIDLPPLDTAGSFSISVWMGPLGTGPMPIVSKNTVAFSDADWQAEFVLRRLPSKQISFLVGSETAGLYNEVVPSYLTTPNWWYHIVAICQQVGTDYTLSVYINNTLMATNTVSYPRKTTSSSQPVQIGRYYLGELQYFDGIIDDLRIYNYALSPAEVSALFNE